MQLLKDYFALQEQIFNYFGYAEDWRVIPLSDNTDMHWVILNGNERGGSVRYHEELESLQGEDDGQYYEDEIYTQRHLPKWVYRGEEYTMICCDPGVDGNVFLRVFDNAKEHRELA